MVRFFWNVELLCFTLLFNFVKRFICQTLRRRANLRKTDLIRRTTYQLSKMSTHISDHFLYFFENCIAKETSCLHLIKLLIKAFGET